MCNITTSGSTMDTFVGLVADIALDCSDGFVRDAYMMAEDSVRQASGVIPNEDGSEARRKAACAYMKSEIARMYCGVSDSIINMMVEIAYQNMLVRCRTARMM